MLTRKPQPARKVNFNGDYPLELPKLEDRLPRAEWQKSMDRWWFDFRTVLMRQREETVTAINGDINQFDTFVTNITNTINNITNQVSEINTTINNFGVVPPPHNLLSATHPDTLAEAVEDGDLLVGYGSPAKWRSLSIGLSGDYLRSDGDNANWSPLHATDIQGVVSTFNGGTGSSITPIEGAVVWTDGDSFELTNPGTVGQILVSGGNGSPTWQAASVAAAHDMLSTTHTDTLAATVSRGSLIIGNSTPLWSELVIGAPNTVLTSDGSDISWASPATIISGTDGYFPYWQAGVPLTSTSQLYQSGSSVGVGETTPLTRLHVSQNDGVTNTITSVLTVGHTGNAFPQAVAGFGVGLDFNLDSTIARREAAQIAAVWSDSTDATRTSYVTITTAKNGTLVEGFRTSSESTTITATDTATNSITTVARITHLTSGTPAANYGTGITFGGDSDTTDDQDISSLQAHWADPTHAVRTGRLRITLPKEGAMLTAATFGGYGTLAIGQAVADIDRAFISVGGSLSSTSTVFGILFESIQTGSGDSIAMQGVARSTFVGTVANTMGLQVRPGRPANAATIVTLATGVNILGPQISAGSVTTSVGLAIAAQDITGVGTGYGIQQKGAADLNYFVGPSAFGTTSPSASLQLLVNTSDAITVAVTEVLRLNHNSSGTPGASFGTGLGFYGKSSTTDQQLMVNVNAAWTVATHATRTSALFFQTVSSAATATTMVLSGAGGLSVGDAIATMPNGVLNVVTGFRVNTSATLGSYLRGNGTNIILNAGVPTTDITGVLPIANGGTNKALTLVNGGVVWTDADSFEVTAAGTTGQVLTSQGAAAPIWTTIATGTITVGGGGTGKTSYTDKSVIFYNASTGFLDEDPGFFTYDIATRQLQVRTDNILITQSDTYGLLITNETAAASGAANQQWSPPVIWAGHGWDGSASKRVEFRNYVATVLGSGNPTGYWVLDHSVNNVAYTELLRADTTGYLRITKNALSSIDTTLAQSAFGLQINNDTASTALVTTQDGPPIVIKGSAWNSSALTSQDWRWRFLMKGVTVAGTTRSYLRVDSGIGGANFANPVVFSSAGGLSVGALIEAAFGVVSAQVGYQIAGGAPSGQFLVGNGTNFVATTVTSSGTFSHAMLSATHTDTTASAVSRGSLITGQGASPTWTELNIGSANRLLRSDGTDAAWAQAVLTTDVTGVLPIANGGTNKALTLVNGGVVWSDADSFEITAAGTAGQILQSNGAAAPSWVAAGAVSLTNDTFDGTGTDFAQSDPVNYEEVVFDAGGTPNTMELTLAAGTWVITAIVQFITTSALNNRYFRLDTSAGLNAYPESEVQLGAIDNVYQEAVVKRIIVLGGSTTVSVWAFADGEDLTIISGLSHMYAVKIA